MGSPRLIMLTASLSFLLILHLGCAENENAASRLHDDLFDDRAYNKEVIPLPSSGGPLNMELGLSLTRLYVDSDSWDTIGLLTATGWLRMRWTDFRLAWDPKDYAGTELIWVTSSKIWTPDIELYNSMDFTSNSYHQTMIRNNFKAIIYHNGTVLHIPGTEIQAICDEFDPTLPDNSAQKCNIKLGSWTVDESHLNITSFHYQPEEEHDFLDLTEMMKQSPWVVISQNDMARKSKTYDGYPDPYCHMDYQFTVQRAFILDPEDEDNASTIENPELPETLADINASYKSGDNRVVI